jgi:hypothetical protein
MASKFIFAYCTSLLSYLRPMLLNFFSGVIYCHSMVIPSLCVIKLFYLGNNHGMAVNYCGIFYNIGLKNSAL